MIKLLGNPWVIIGLAAICFASGATVSSWYYKQKIEAIKNGELKQAISNQNEAIKSVENIKAQIKRDADKQKAERERNEQDKREIQEKADHDRNNAIHELRSRYEKQLAENQQCATWSKQLVACRFQ